MAKGRKTGGRKTGTPNKSTADAREAIARFVDGNVGRLEGWLDEEVARTEGPRAAFRCVLMLLEYYVPKLAHTELTGKDGQSVKVAAVVDELQA
jgi:hypothetical protein